MKEGWEYNSLGKVCRIYNGNSINADYKKKHYQGLSEGYPFIATKDVSFNGNINYENGVRIPFDENLKIAYPKSVFICVEGGSAGRKIGLVERKVCFGNKLFCLEPKNTIIGNYLYYYLKSDVFQSQFSERLTGLIGGVSAKKFSEIGIVYPSLSEQQSVVDYLDTAFAKIDALKANAEKQLNDARALFQTELSKSMKPKEGWEEKTLKDITSKIGSGATPKGGRKVYITDGVSLVRSMNVHDDYFKYDELAHINDEAAHLLDGVELKENDVLINITGASITRCCVIPSDILPARVNQHVSIIRISCNVEPRFLCLLLTSADHKRSLLKIGEAGSTRQALTKSDLEKHIVKIPTLSEQQQIVAHLDALSEKVKELEKINEQTQKECDALKEAMLREIFE